MRKTLITMAAATALTAPAYAHPLDPLSIDEHWRVLEILESSGRLTSKTRFNRIALSPPDKTKILAWKDGPALPRIAEVRLKEGAAAVEALVDLGAGKVTGWTVRTDVQPAWLIEEFLGSCRNPRE